ncbi:hypothetical protein ABIB51_001173 [Arthrobacter sp. UYCu712]
MESTGNLPRLFIRRLLSKWDSYPEAKETMFHATDTGWAPWTVVKSNDKKRARLEAMRHVLHMFDYEDKDTGLVAAPDSLIVGPASRFSRTARAPKAVRPTAARHRRPGDARR